MEEEFKNTENRIKEMKAKIKEILKSKNITFYEWSRIENYINQEYEKIKIESTLK